MSAIYPDELPVPSYSLSIPLAAIHILFFASFLLPSIYLAWHERSEEDLRNDRTPLWLGLPFAIFTAILCFMTYRHFEPARIYLSIYAVLATMVTALRASPDLAIFREGSVARETADERDEQGGPGGAPASGTQKAGTCEPRLVDQLGSDTPAVLSGSSGRHWLPGSNFYEWELRVEVTQSDHNGIVAVASASGSYIPWYGVSRRRVEGTPRRAQAKVYCSEQQGECVIAAMASQVKPRKGAFVEAIAISWQPIGDSIQIRVEASAAVEAKLFLEVDEISGSLGGNVGIAELKGQIKAKVNRLNEAKAEAALDRSYLYRCEPVRPAEAPASG